MEQTIIAHYIPRGIFFAVLILYSFGLANGSENSTFFLYAFSDYLVYLATCCVLAFYAANMLSKFSKSITLSLEQQEKQFDLAFTQLKKVVIAGFIGLLLVVARYIWILLSTGYVLN